jgi:hypothetical protein
VISGGWTDVIGMVGRVVASACFVSPEIWSLMEVSGLGLVEEVSGGQERNASATRAALA